MAETALNFGPDWLRALSHGSNTSSMPSSSEMPIPKYSLAEFRYGREEMLALIPKTVNLPDCLKEFPHLAREKFQVPLALTPVTEDEQRIWARSVNSDAVLRASGKTVPGNNNMGRSTRGGSVDRGRGRGRGGYYQRGLTYEDSEDGPSASFSRLKTIERSQSANEKDQRWDDRDRRFDRTFSGRGGGMDDSVLKQESSRGPNEHWRKFDKDDDGDWRPANSRSDKLGGRGSWRSNLDKDRKDVIDRTSQNRNINGTVRNVSHQKTGSHHSWKENGQGNNLPEWSVEEANEPDVVGTFDSSGAFLETKMAENTSLDEIYVSDDADEGPSKEDSPEAKKETSKKMPKKSTNSVSKQPAIKQSTEIIKAEESFVEKHLHPSVSELSKNISRNSTKIVEETSTDNVVKTCTVAEQQHAVKKKTEYTNVTLPNVPDIVMKNAKSDSVILNNARSLEVPPPISLTMEEDAFAHHKKATENMVAQWTEEEEQRVICLSNDIRPPPHEKESKWFYQDPQGEVQGPFTSAEMLEWFSTGYFTMGLMVRRNCDEKFSQLGELIKSWGRVPFMPGNSPPPIRVTPMTSSLSTPMTQTIVPNPVAAPAQLPKQDEQLLALQQQLLQQQIMQQQLMLRQAQLQQLLAQLKQQDNFTNLNSQQQQQVLIQQFIAQQQVQRPNIGPSTEQQGHLDSMTPLPIPLLGLTLPSLMKNDISLWNMAASSGTWPVNLNAAQTVPPGGSIWDVDIPKSNTEVSESEKQKRLAEEQEKVRKVEELRLEKEREMEEKRKHEELRRKLEEERHLKELQKLEEEKRKLEEFERKQEEEKRHQEELRQLEEHRRREELKREEERQRLEAKRLEEIKRQEEQKRLEELRRKEEEQRKLDELRKQEELQKQEELRKLEEKRKKEEFQKLQLEKDRKKQLEQEKLREALRMKELEREEKLQRECEKKEREEMEMKRLAELKIKSQGPVWGVQNAQNKMQLSLPDIQRLQEEKEREEKEERMRQQILQQQAVKQVQSKSSLSWAKRTHDSVPAVKSLAEIQLEEAERLAQIHRNQKPPAPAPVINSNVGVWGNASHLNKITAAVPSWNMPSVPTSGFWEDALNSTPSRKQPEKANDSAFPALANPVQPASVNSNKSKNVRAKREEDVVTRLFGTHRKPTDEFTLWCTEALSSMPSSVDVPTFIAFLKDIESPYEVHDYIKSYLGEGKEPREFAKQFLEKRSKYRNQAKQVPVEDNMLWGPAPAITPAVNKTAVLNTNDCDGNFSTKGKTRKRKGRMQKLDSSMLGFTVQSNPDRLNVGEIDHGEGM